MKKSDPKLIDKIGLGPEERELKLGTSFTNPRESAFHTLRYDFKPASVDTNKMATIDVGTNSQVTVNLPPNFIFRGSAKPYHRHCIAVVNPVTGDVTLEKLTFNIQVKNIRSENQKMSAQKMSMIDQFISGQKPKKTNSVKGPKSQTVTNNSSNNSGTVNNSTNNSNNNSSTSTSSNNLKNSGLKPGKKSKAKPPQPAPNMNNLLPMHSNSARNSPNSLISMPTGLSPNNASQTKSAIDDQAALDDWFNSLDTGRSNSVKQDTKKIPVKDETKPSIRLNDDVGELSDSSSSCGSSGSGDSSDSSSDSESQEKKKVPVQQNGRMNNPSADAAVLLKEDLELSESGSDSD